jgi:hypothetical protein
VKQRHATSEIRLNVRRARYRERDFPDAAQIARFGSGCAPRLAGPEDGAEECDDKNKAKPAPSNHGSRLLAVIYSCKLQSLGTGRNSWHLFSAKGALSSSACGIAAGCESGRTKALKARINPWLDLVNRAFSARIFRIPESWGVAPGFR